MNTGREAARKTKDSILSEAARKTKDFLLIEAARPGTNPPAELIDQCRPILEALTAAVVATSGVAELAEVHIEVSNALFEAQRVYSVALRTTRAPRIYY